MVVPWNSRFLGWPPVERDQLVERVLEGLGILQRHGQEHPLAVFLDRLLEVADDRDPVAERVEDVLLELERLAAVGADELLLDHVEHAGLEHVGQLVEGDEGVVEVPANALVAGDAGRHPRLGLEA